VHRLEIDGAVLHLVLREVHRLPDHLGRLVGKVFRKLGRIVHCF
tara:strand:+ start:1473 stop:1604 length:132 start_codon:yes stop_codon:yes gene_type:complete